MSTNDQLQENLSAAGYRMTRQRRVVYESLHRLGGHPSAEAVYRSARKMLPKISLATVYNALDSLVDARVARRLAARGASARFEPTREEHLHARCVGCDALFDLPLTRDLHEEFGGQRPDGFEVERVEVELIGLCESCRPSPH